MSEPSAPERPSTDEILRDMAITRLTLTAADMASIHAGLVEADLLPDLQSRLHSWIRAVVDARTELKRPTPTETSHEANR